MDELLTKVKQNLIIEHQRLRHFSGQGIRIPEAAKGCKERILRCVRRFRCLLSGQGFNQPLRIFCFGLVAAFQRHILLLGHELIHIVLVKAVV